MRILRYLLHLVQFGLIYAIYLMNDLYQNHLGFMRNVSFYSHKVEASAFGSKLFLLPLLLLILAFVFIAKKKSPESLLLILLGIVFLIWQTVISLEITPIYYLVSGIICLGFFVQVVVVFLKRSDFDGVLKSNN